MNMSTTDLITAMGAILAGIGLIYTGIQVRLARKTARSQFLIQLYQLMEQHNELHLRLTRSGWPDGRNGPETDEEWIKVGRLLGLFEYIKILVDDNTIDIDTVDRLYSYRLFHLVNNDVIRRRHLENKDGGWAGVIELWGELEDRKLWTQLRLKHSSQPGH